MALTLSGTNGVVGAGFTLDPSGVSVTAGIGTFGTLNVDDKIIHTGDTDTTIRFPGNDQISFETNGAEKLRIASDGKIGIGTTNPQYALDISDSASSGIRIGVATHAYRMRANVSSTNDYGFFIEDEEGNDLYNARGPHATSDPNIHVFSTAGAERLRITGAGSSVIGSIRANGSFYQEDTYTTGDDALDKTIEFNRRGVFLMLISFSLGTTTTEFSRNIYSLGLFTSRSDGATWTAIQQDLTSSHVGNFTISDNSVRGQLRVQKSGGSDARVCAFRIDVLSSADVNITVTDT